MDYKKLKEEPLKSAVQQDFFNNYKYTQLGNIDFVIAKNIVDKGQTSLFDEFENDELKSLLWAEAKQGTSHDIFESFVQLILTIGKERTFEKYLPPKYIGAFDAEKFAFIEYHQIQHIFYQNDFNWNVTPSNHETKEFRQLHALCQNLLEESSILFYFETQANEFKEFIRLNFKTGKEATEKISVTKNNFTFVFQKWSEKVRPTISVDWAKANKAGIISADFFLADLLSSNEESLKDSLYVVLRKTKYELAKKIDEMGLVSTSSVGFNDKQKAYKQFWSIYSRPPKEEYWDYIIGRRDLLVPQDIRERKGSYFTPQIWVEKSQQYLADVLGETWQDEYYIWDCCAGTGNLLNGLTNYDRVWASTLDKQDVDVMMDRINNGWSMAENHVFQFDFLNDDFTQCPEELQAILNSPEKRKKLVVYINPPYAEASNARTSSGTGANRAGLSDTVIRAKYKDSLGRAANELFAQFYARIVREIPTCVLAVFSKLKTLQAPNFSDFRKNFRAKLGRIFLVPANTFDNVTGQFPIGFQIWRTATEDFFTYAEADVYDAKGEFIGTKTLIPYSNSIVINRWLSQNYDNSGLQIGWIRFVPNDFQNNRGVFFVTEAKDSDIRESRVAKISVNNFIPCSVYFAVRHSIEANWLNDRDQFLYPNDGWSKDMEFHTDCLIFTLFHGQNRISSQQGVNHWIPFTREQVGCRKTFKSTFMSNYLRGKITPSTDTGLFGTDSVCTPSLQNLSPEAQAVYDAGLALWRYYHSQPNAIADASFYDIRLHFQGTNDKGSMNAKSDDATYTEFIANLREKMKLLAKRIEPKVYEYGFLK
ncbi:MAG: hypothetical protein K6A94_05715 [Bacteroidales bacterium]|nr:hypothetical protein [Bacteroidales bacterium]